MTAHLLYQSKAGHADVAPGRPTLQATCSCCACWVCTYAACTVQPSWGPFGAVEGIEGNDGVGGAFPSLELADNSWEAFGSDEEGGSLLGRAHADLSWASTRNVPDVLRVGHGTA